MTSHRLITATLAVTLSMSTVAEAQGPEGGYDVPRPEAEPSQEAMARARDLFVEAQGHVEAGRWADALERFEECYRLSGIPAALFNVGTTLRSMGRHRDARDAFNQLLELEGLDEQTRSEAQSRRNEEAGRVALILLSGLEEAPDAHVMLDGLEVRIGARDPVELETDPGRHAVRVERDGYQSWRHELELADGERARLRAGLEIIDTPAPIVIAPEGEEVWESPVLWVIVGVVVAGAAAVTGVVLWDQAQLSPRGTFQDTVVRL